MSVFKSSVAYRPFTYSWAVEAAKKHSIDMHWHENQIELQDDLRQYNTKDGLKTANVSHEVHKAIVDTNLFIFTELDRNVGELYTKLLPYVKNNEIRTMMLTFAAREVIHQRAYALLAETFGFTDRDWQTFTTYKEMRDKLDLMVNDLTTPDMRDELKFCIGMAQLFLGEGIGLFCPFTTFLNLKRKGLFMGFNDVNNWSLIDEQEHVINNIRTWKEARKDLTIEEDLHLIHIVVKLVQAYVDAEIAYARVLCAKGDQEDLTLDQMIDYMQYLGELRMFQMGLIPSFDVRDNPLPWMEWMLSAGRHANFFEKRVTEYSHAKLPGEINYNKYAKLLEQRA